LAAAAPVQAADEGGGAAINALVRARLAEARGEPAAALSALTEVSSLAPALPGVRGRILEQAIEAGDFEAARTAALQLWNGGERRFDAQLVLLVDAMRRSDWKAARADQRVDRRTAALVGGLHRGSRRQCAGDQQQAGDLTCSGNWGLRRLRG
jgi:hypothetical protein